MILTEEPAGGEVDGSRGMRSVTERRRVVEPGMKLRRWRTVVGGEGGGVDSFRFVEPVRRPSFVVVVSQPRIQPWTILQARGSISVRTGRSRLRSTLGREEKGFLLLSDPVPLLGLKDPTRRVPRSPR